MTRLTAGRAAAGLVALTGTAGPAWGWHFGHKPCAGPECADTQRVVIPSREVEVVQEQPRVVVREAPATRIVSKRSVEVGFAPAPAIGAVYMPVAMPMMGFGFAGASFGGAAPATREVVRESTREASSDFNPLEAAHRAELHALRTAGVQAELEAAVESQRRVLSRMAPANRAPATERAPADCPSSAAVEQKLGQLTAEIQKLNERVTSVEKLLVYHDNWILARTSQAGVAPAPAAPPVMTAPRAVPTTAEPAVPAGGAPVMAPPLPAPGLPLPAIPHAR